MSRARALLNEISEANPFVKKLTPESGIKDIEKAFTSALTNWDKKLQAKRPNNSRLAIAFKAVDKFIASLKDGDSPEEQKKKASKVFILNRNGKFDITPINQIGKKLGWF